jgi:hypothetical protein
MGKVRICGVPLDVRFAFVKDWDWTYTALAWRTFCIRHVHNYSFSRTVLLFAAICSEIATRLKGRAVKNSERWCFSAT